MNKIALGLTGLAALVASQVVSMRYAYAQPELSGEIEALEWANDDGVESKLLGCFVPADEKDFLERNYRRVSPKFKNKTGLKEAYCAFAESFSRYLRKNMLKEAIDKMKQIGADKVDPMVGYMYIHLGNALEKDYVLRTIGMRNWVELAASSDSYGEFQEQLKERDKKKAEAEKIWDDEIKQYKKGVDIILQFGMYDKTLRTAACSVCRDIITHAKYRYDWDEVKRYERIREQLDKTIQ